MHLSVKYTILFSMKKLIAEKKKKQYRHLPAFILLALAEKPNHGGEIVSILTNRMPIKNADAGAVYRALQKLEQEGEVTSTWDTSNAGPAKKIYRLTSAGLNSLEYWKEDIEMRISILTFFMTKYNQIKKDIHI